MQDDDFKWFVDNYDSLFAQYGSSFLAIKDRKVFGVYHSFGEGVREARKLEKPGTFIVQKCNGSPSAYNTYIASTNFM